MAAIIVKELNRLPKDRDNTYIDLELDLIINYTKSNTFKNNVTEQSDIRADYDINAIKNSIYNIFTTMPGQKILNPTFGLNLFYFIFNGISQSNARILGDTILKGIAKYEPRVNVSNIDITLDIENQQYNIDMVLSVPTLNINDFKIKSTLAESGYYFN
jgi:phage baseplate assembly protein W